MSRTLAAANREASKNLKYRLFPVNAQWVLTLNRYLRRRASVLRIDRFMTYF